MDGWVDTCLSILGQENTNIAYVNTHTACFTFWFSCSMASCSSSFSISICSCLFLCSFSSSACWNKDVHDFCVTYCIWFLCWIFRRCQTADFTLYVFTKRTNTGKNTDGGMVLEFSPKNLTTSSKASWKGTIVSLNRIYNTTGNESDWL